MIPLFNIMKASLICSLVLLGAIASAAETKEGRRTLRGKVIEDNGMHPIYDEMRVLLDAGTDRERLALPTT